MSYPTYRRKFEIVEAIVCGAEMRIDTPEGFKDAKPGDLVVIKSNGDHEVFRPPAFHAMYERCPEPPAISGLVPVGALNKTSKDEDNEETVN